MKYFSNDDSFVYISLVVINCRQRLYTLYSIKWPWFPDLKWLYGKKNRYQSKTQSRIKLQRTWLKWVTFRNDACFVWSSGMEFIRNFLDLWTICHILFTFTFVRDFFTCHFIGLSTIHMKIDLYQLEMYQRGKTVKLIFQPVNSEWNHPILLDELFPLRGVYIVEIFKDFLLISMANVFSQLRQSFCRSLMHPDQFNALQCRC